MVETLRLATLKSYGVLDTPAEAAFDAIAFEAARALHVPSAVVSFIDEDRQWYKARFGVEASFVPRAISFCTHILDSDDVTVVADTRKDARFLANPFVIGEPHIRFYAAAPIKALNRQRVGTVCVFDTEPRSGTSDRERRHLSALAARTVELLEQRRWAERSRAAAMAAPRAAVVAQVGR
ncbi:GAF domain-containing protein [Sphingomonas sp. KR1UV-12]|uniref:GAF domain-containing protein n=1 Tax=Sphingomonas aurea TaxID=3063994 RepID=A0ABT9EKB2_9SPHN|nr:GAF domain-containing protein [Sphingomonas sp. KR1UV-12]MDP1027290.1 GAF domain-containing protein [Sphingomonas sp. KR1UV-12]